MITYIQCPAVYNGKEKSLFLAGGISGCGDWQSEMKILLDDLPLVIINPRRKDFDINNPKMEKEQITWEYRHLKKATATSFWFPSETLCPITLYELGRKSTNNKPLFVGVNPSYKRRSDVEIQLSLVRPDARIVYSLKDLASQIKGWALK